MGVESTGKGRFQVAVEGRSLERQTRCRGCPMWGQSGRQLSPGASPPAVRPCLYIAGQNAEPHVGSNRGKERHVRRRSGIRDAARLSFRVAERDHAYRRCRQPKCGPAKRDSPHLLSLPSLRFPAARHRRDRIPLPRTSPFPSPSFCCVVHLLCPVAFPSSTSLLGGRPHTSVLASLHRTLCASFRVFESASGSTTRAHAHLRIPHTASLRTVKTLLRPG